MGTYVYFVIQLIVLLCRAQSISRRNVQRQVDNLERRYEHDFVSLKENLRDLWDIVDQLEAMCQVSERTTAVTPIKQFSVQHKNAARTPAEITELIRGFSEEKEFLRTSLKDMTNEITGAQASCTNTVAKKMNYVNEIDARCSNAEKDLKLLRIAQSGLMEKIERTSERVTAEVNGLRLVINQAVEEVIQDSIFNRPSSCMDLVKKGVTSSGVYTMHYKMQPFMVFCLMKDGGGYTFISPETYMYVNINNLSNDNSHVVIRHRRTNGLQYESRIEQISSHRTRPLSIQYNAHAGYTGTVNGLMTPYIYIGLIPIKLKGRIKSHRGNRQGYKSNGKDFTFINCDGNPIGYFAFMFNHNNVSPSGRGEFPAISRKWIETSTRVTGDILPDKFMSFFELYFGGCGAYVGANHIHEVSGAAVGIPFTLS